MLLKSLIKHLKTAKPNQVYANAEGVSASSLLGRLLHYVTELVSATDASGESLLIWPQNGG
jgi:hypothetical protein